jgi:hypothetical protein
MPSPKTGHLRGSEGIFGVSEFPMDGREQMLSHARRCKHCRGAGQTLGVHFGGRVIWLHRDCYAPYRECHPDV